MPATGSADDLGLLLATEERLERALAAVRDECDQLRATAAAEAARADAEAAASLDGARRLLSEELAGAKAARIADIEREARAAVARWDGLRDAALDREARRLARRLVALATEGP